MPKTENIRCSINQRAEAPDGRMNEKNYGARKIQYPS